MAQIDAKWILFDDTKLTTISEEVDGVITNYLSIREDIVLEGVGVEYINGSKIEVRTLSQGDPIEDPERDMTRDMWFQIPDPV